MMKMKARFEIFDFYLSQSFNFTCNLKGKETRALWNDDQQIVWGHFIHLDNDEVNSGLKQILFNLAEVIIRDNLQACKSLV